VNDASYLLVVPDGMADWPQEELDGQTPLEAASTPNLERLCEAGRTFRIQNIPPESPADSGVANMALLGYDPRKYYLGRGALEALNLGLELDDDQVAYRCNLVTVDNNDRLIDYSAGGLPGEVGAALFSALQEEFGGEKYTFHHGVGYRGILLVREVGELDCSRPHDEMGRPVQELLPRGEAAERLTRLMWASQDFLREQPENRALLKTGEPTANMIWPWGPGRLSGLPGLKERYGIQGSVIAGVDLINGLGQALGMEKIDVPGATGGFDTDMRAKADAAIAELEPGRLVFLHLEAPDEAGHDGDARLKLEMIEKFDSEILSVVYKRWQKNKFHLALGPDHYTPIQERTHVKEPVPFLVLDGGKNKYTCTESGSREAPFAPRAWNRLAHWYKENGEF